jgi:hypothetical protein
VLAIVGVYAVGNVPKQLVRPCVDSSDNNDAAREAPRSPGERRSGRQRGTREQGSPGVGRSPCSGRAVVCPPGGEEDEGARSARENPPAFGARRVDRVSVVVAGCGDVEAALARLWDAGNFQR